MKKTLLRASPLCLLGLCLVLFTSSATTDLALPGPHAIDDETPYAALAIDLLRPKFPYSQDYSLHIGNQPFPFGISRRAGALNAYLLWPLFASFGPSVELKRTFAIFLGLWVLIFCYFFLSECFGQTAAFCATLLLSLDCSFIFYSKLDMTVTGELLWLVICLWSLNRWCRTHYLRDLVVGLFSGILGIYCHITFVWFVVACLLGGLLFFPQELQRLFKKPAVYFVIPSALCGLTIFLYWLVGDQTLLFQRTLRFPEVFMMFERLSVMGGFLPDILLGRYTKLLSIPGIQTRPPTDVFLLMSSIFLILCWKKDSRLLRFLLFAAGTILLEICLTPQSTAVLIYHRMMLFYIFLIFMGGIAMAQSGRFLKNYKHEPFWINGASLVIFLLAILSILGQMALKQEADQRIRQTGGKGFWSDAIYSLAYFVKKGPWQNTIYLNWDHNSLVLLTRGEVPVSPFLWNVHEKEKRRTLSRVISEASPQTLFLYGPMAIVTLQELRKVCQDLGKTLTLEHIFYDKEGDPVYFAYTVK